MNNDVKTPDWMNQDWFAMIVKHNSGDVKAKLRNVTLKPSLTPGEQVVSNMIRAQIDFSTTSKSVCVLSVVIKVPPAIQSDVVETSPLFENEIDMYNGPLKDTKDLLESIGDFTQIHPKLIYCAMRPHQVIVMEDLGALGYEKIFQPLENYVDSQMVFKRLAKYHAACYFLINEKKVDYSRFDFSIFHQEDSFIRDKFLIESIDTLIEVMTSWSGCEEYVMRLKAFRESFLENGRKLYTPDPNGFNVVNHGDFHIKNLLFKRNGNDIEDFFMMDFQISVLASPCVDLYYALYNMISDENRRARQEEIIHDYHSEFTSTLKKLGFIGKIPSLLDLQMDLIRHGQMEVVKCIVFKIFFWVDAANADNNAICGPDSARLKAMIFNDPRYENFIKTELPRLINKGFL